MSENNNGFPVGMQIPMTPEMRKTIVKQDVVKVVKTFTEAMILENKEYDELVINAPHNEMGLIAVGICTKEIEDMGGVVVSHSVYPVPEQLPNGQVAMSRHVSFLVKRRQNRIVT